MGTIRPFLCLGLYIATLVLCATELNAQAPVNDECSGALALQAGRNGPFSTRNATSSQPPLCGQNGSRDVWFRFLPSGDSHLLIAFEPIGVLRSEFHFEVLVGTCAGLSSVHCGSSFAMALRYLHTASAGTTVFLRAGLASSLYSTEFDIVLSPVSSAGNDNCMSAVSLALGGNGPFTNLGATISTPFPCDFTVGGDVWFRYTCSTEGEVQFGACVVSEIQPVMQVFSGSCNNLIPRQCLPSNCGDFPRFVFLVQRGETLWLRIGGQYQSQGLFTIAVSEFAAPPNDECGNAIPIVPGPNGPFALTGSSLSRPWPGIEIGDVWFRVTAPSDGEYALLFCSQDPSARWFVESFDGTCANLVSRADSTSLPCSEDYPWRMSLRANETRWFRVSVQAFFPYRRLFNIEALFGATPANDEGQGAIDLSEGSNGSFSTLGATLSLPFPCQTGAQPPPRDIWFRYQPTDAPSLILFETCLDCDVYMAMELRRGYDLNSESLACSSQYCSPSGRGVRIAFDTSDNRPLYLRLGTYNSQPRGNLYIQVTELRRPRYRTVPTGCHQVKIGVSGNFRPGQIIRVEIAGVSGRGPTFLIAGEELASPVTYCPGESCQIGVDPLVFLLGGAAWRVPYEPWFLGDVMAVQALQIPWVPSNVCLASPPVATTSDTIVFVFP